MTYDIQDFVRDAFKNGQSRDQISKALLAARWRQADIDAALAHYATDVSFAIPVPRPKAHLSAKEAFIYLLLYLCLYISAWSTGSILFKIINTNFPDATYNNYYGNGDLSGLRMATAALIVTYPLFLWLSYITRRSARDPEETRSGIRRALTYLTLFIAAGVMIGDVIALLYNFLQGEIATRFILKVVTILVIAAAIFGYYLWDLRKDEKV